MTRSFHRKPDGAPLHRDPPGRADCFRIAEGFELDALEGNHLEGSTELDHDL